MNIHNLAAALLLIPASLAFAQYRDGQPPVLSKPPATLADNSGAIIAAFKEKYTSSKEPRIALFWNRSLSDTTARQSLQRSTTSSTKSSSSKTVGGNDDKNEDKLERASSSSVNSIESVDDELHSSLDPRADILLKSTFVDAMRNGGVRFVDHSLMVRIASAEATGVTDPQLNEIKGLQSKADWIMEITLVPDPVAPLGQGFRIAVKDVKSGALLTEIYTPAIPPSQRPAGHIAVNGDQGFMPAPEVPITVRAVGYTLGVETMGHLINVL